MPKIFSALDIARSEADSLLNRFAGSSIRERIRFLCTRPEVWLSTKNTPFTGNISGPAVIARVDFGRWIADCSPECGGSEYVAPAEPIFYCCSCGNRNNGGDARPVVFPNEREAIEAELLRRPVTFESDDPREFFLKSRPAVRGLSRSWNPGETVQDLIDQSSKAGI